MTIVYIRLFSPPDLEKKIEKSVDSGSILSEILALLVRISMEFEDFTTEYRSNIRKKHFYWNFFIHFYGLHVIQMKSSWCWPG
jgi:hypothetical protein